MELFKNVKVYFRDLISLIVVAGTYWILYMLTKHAIPESNRDLFNVCVGMVLNATIGRVMRTHYPEKEETKKPSSTKENDNK